MAIRGLLVAGRDQATAVVCKLCSQDSQKVIFKSMQQTALSLHVACIDNQTGHQHSACWQVFEREQPNSALLPNITPYASASLVRTVFKLSNINIAGFDRAAEWLAPVVPLAAILFNVSLPETGRIRRFQMRAARISSGC